jgi:hypothetical protein
MEIPWPAFYLLGIQPDLFGKWRVVREWGASATPEPSRKIIRKVHIPEATTMDQDEQIKQLRSALEKLLPLAQQERNRLTRKIDEFSGDEDIIASDACTEASRVLANTRPDDSASRSPDADNKTLSITQEASADITVLHDGKTIYGFGETEDAAFAMAYANYDDIDFFEDAYDYAAASPALASELRTVGIIGPCKILDNGHYVGRQDEEGRRVAAHFGNEIYVLHFTPELVQKDMAAHFHDVPYQISTVTEKCAREYFLAPGGEGVQLLADGRLGTLDEGEQSPIFAIAREAMMRRHSLEHLPESVRYRSMEPAADTLQRHDKERDDLARRFSRIDFSMDSPWGKVEDGGWIVKGHCYTVDTARHGGVRVSEKVNQEIPETLRDEEGWYEEDRAWSIPFAFSGLGAGKYGPVESPFHSLESACETASRYYPEEYSKLQIAADLDRPPAPDVVSASVTRQLMRQMYYAEKGTRDSMLPSPVLDVSGANPSTPEKTVEEREITPDLKRASNRVDVSKISEADRKRIRSTDSKLLTPQERRIQRRMLVAEATVERPTPEPGHER